jgi:hypothetical protein
MQVALCDGSSRFITESVDMNIWHAVGSVEGGEVVGPVP